MNLIIMELQNEEINAKKINAVKDATYAVAKTKPEKKVLSFVWTKGEYNNYVEFFLQHVNYELRGHSNSTPFYKIKVA